MTRRSIGLDDAVGAYLTKVSVREPDVLRRLREETAAMPMAGMQVGPEQGRFMAWLIELVGAKRTLEIGVFTGYSSLWVALALPLEGTIVACDVSAEWTAVGRRYWREAGVADKIELRLAPALETLDALLAAGEAGGFDFAFVDAEKTEYADYYERVLELMRPGGLIAVDNVLWNGAVADPARDDADTVAIRAFNEMLGGDDRVSLAMVPIGDGLTLARKR